MGVSAFSPDGTPVVTFDAYDKAGLWAVASGKRVGTLTEVVRRHVVAEDLGRRLRVLDRAVDEAWPKPEAPA